MRRRKPLIFLFFISVVLLFGYQNCTPVGNQKSISVHSTKLQGGNGDGYVGIQIFAPDHMNPGQKSAVFIEGGQAPYQVFASDPSISIQSSGQVNEFEVLVSEQSSASSFFITVKDRNGLTASKEIIIVKLDVRVLDGGGGHLGGALGIWNDRVVIQGGKYYDNTYAQGGLFTFRYEGFGAYSSGSVLLGSDDPDHSTNVLDIYQNFMLTGFSYRKIGDKRLAGSATLYRFSEGEWRKVSAILPQPVAPGIHFGASVSVTKGGFAIGSSPGNTIGRVHLYSLSEDGEFELDEIIYDPDQKFKFGYKLKRYHDLLFVSGLNADGGYNPMRNPGHVDVFRKTDQGWRREGHLESRTPMRPNACGHSLDYDGEVLAVGCPRQGGQNDLGSDAPGSVDVFIHAKDGTWQRVQELRPDGEPKFNLFGSAVSLHNGLLAVGSPFEPAVYLYRFNSTMKQFERIGKLTDVDVSGNLLGNVISVHDNRVLVGVDGGLESYAYIFDIEGHQ